MDESPGLIGMGGCLSTVFRGGRSGVDLEELPALDSSVPAAFKGASAGEAKIKRNKAGLARAKRT